MKKLKYLILLMIIGLGNEQIYAQTQINDSPIYFTSSGLIGIGTSSPSSGRIHMDQYQDNITGGFRFRNKTNSQSTFLWMDSLNVFHFDNSSGGGRDFIFNESGTGKLGIGVKPLSRLHVFQATGEGPYVIIEGGGGILQNTALRLYDRGTSNGNINVIDFAFSNAGVPVSTARMMAKSVSSNAANGSQLILETASNNHGNYNSNQLFLNYNGNIGIGTSNPGGILNIVNNKVSSYQNALRIDSYNPSEHWLMTMQTNNKGNFSGFFTNNQNNIRLLLRDSLANVGVQLISMGDSYINGGKLGIGTTSPQAQMEIAGKSDNLFVALKLRNTEGSGSFSTSVGLDFHHLNSPVEPNARIFEKEGPNNNTHGGNLFFATRTSSSTLSSTSLVNRMVIAHNGNIGIGTEDPQSLLSVNGVIKAKEIEVTLTGWPDYVFRPNYQLMPLETLETFIQQHGHLPEIPSESTVEAEGVNLGEMDKLLLKKIEELSLYIIEQNKLIKNQQEKLVELENKIEKIKN